MAKQAVRAVASNAPIEPDGERALDPRRRMHPKVSKGEEALPPSVTGMGRADESSETEQCERQRSNTTIELADDRKALWSRLRARNAPNDRKHVTNALDMSYRADEDAGGSRGDFDFPP